MGEGDDIPGSPGFAKARGARALGREGRGAGRGGGDCPADCDRFPLLLPACRMDKVGDALEEVLSKALSQRTITVGVYEAAKLLNV